VNPNVWNNGNGTAARRLYDASVSMKPAVEKVTSSKSFGLTVAFVLLIVAAVNYWSGGRWYGYWAVLAGVTLAISLLLPRVLAPLKRGWLRLGNALNYIVSPIVLGLIYVLAIVPVGIAIRLFGKDLLLLRRDSSTGSYWIRRDAGGPAPESLRDQF
jgi:hypothetical protein